MRPRFDKLSQDAPSVIYGANENKYVLVGTFHGVRTHSSVGGLSFHHAQPALVSFSFRRPQSHERDRPIPESVVEIDRDGAKSRKQVGAAASDASKVGLRFGHLKGG
jgi:hypothetical protein